jgi:peptide/nickel transport system permease protein
VVKRLEYIVRRLLLAVLVVVGASIVTFVVARLVPADPAALWVGPRASPERLKEARVKLGLDRPLYEQYLRYVGDVLRGDFGVSVKTRRPIIDELRVFLPATLELVLFAMFITVLVGIPLGVLAAAWRESLLDHFSRIFAVTNASLPAFWLALLLQLVFVGYLGLLPLGGRVSRDIAMFSPIGQISGFYLVDAAVTRNWPAFRDALFHIILPGLTLASYGIGLSIRMTRANMVEVLEQKYITAARALGLRARTIYFKLALKNAIVPTLTVLGLTLVWNITGAMLVEIIFRWPGLGTYLVDAVLNFDFPVVVSVTLVVTVMYVLVNLTLDLLQAMVDPRVSLE